MNEAQLKFDEFLRRRGLKLTDVRRTIFEAIAEFDGPFEMETLLQRPSTAEVAVSRATLHRTVALLVESGVLRHATVSRSGR